MAYERINFREICENHAVNPFLVRRVLQEIKDRLADTSGGPKQCEVQGIYTFASYPQTTAKYSQYNQYLTLHNHVGKSRTRLGKSSVFRRMLFDTGSSYIDLRFNSGSSNVYWFRVSAGEGWVPTALTQNGTTYDLTGHTVDLLQMGWEPADLRWRFRMRVITTTSTRTLVFYLRKGHNNKWQVSLTNDFVTMGTLILHEYNLWDTVSETYVTMAAAGDSGDEVNQAEIQTVQHAEAMFWYHHNRLFSESVGAWPYRTGNGVGA